MSMTKLEYMGRRQIIRKLIADGFVSYAKLFALSEFNFTSDDDVIGYTINGKDQLPDKIVLNRSLTEEQASVVVRHEIMHNYLEHEKRIFAHLGKDKWNNDFKDYCLHDLFNIAADFEISNEIYGDEEKKK